MINIDANILVLKFMMPIYAEHGPRKIGQLNTGIFAMWVGKFHKFR